MDRSRVSRSVLALAVASLLACCLMGCSEPTDPRLSSPTKTMETYFAAANELQKAPVVPELYLKTLKCFTKADRQWFDQNYKTLTMPESAKVYEPLILDELNRRAALLAFVVVRRGPYKGKVTEKSVSGSEATIEVEGFARPIALVKEGANWRIKGLFGVGK